MLFPFLYEGFGLPVLEAMSLGTPVITSKAASLTEVAGDSALLVDPLDIQAMTKVIQKIDADSDLRADPGQRGAQRAKEFSPAAYRRRIGTLYRSVLGSNSIPLEEACAREEYAGVWGQGKRARVGW